MRFSLITATLGRRDELVVLFESLTAQSFKDFELILVDQNTDGRLDEIVATFSGKFNLIHIKSSVKGLSHNRNIGLEIAQGDIVAFPDDDCYYSNDVLSKVDESFKQHKNLKLRLIKIGDPVSRQIYMYGKNDLVKRSELMRFAISFNIFLPRNCAMRFDTRLGCGAPYGSGEESDFLWENLNHDDHGIFVNSAVYHPNGTASYRDCSKLYSYGLGWGAIYKKEIFKRKNTSAIMQYCYGLARSVGGIILKPEKREYYNTLKGRIKGFLSFPVK